MILDELINTLEDINADGKALGETQVVMRVMESTIPIDSIKVVTTIINDESRTEIFIASSYAKF